MSSLSDLANDPSVPDDLYLVATEDPPSIALFTNSAYGRRTVLGLAVALVVANLAVVIVGVWAIGEPNMVIPVIAMVAFLAASVYFLRSMYTDSTDLKKFEVDSSHVWTALGSQAKKGTTPEVKINTDAIVGLELHKVQKMMEPGTIETVGEDCTIRYTVDGERQELSLMGGEVGSAALLLKSINWFRPDLDVRTVKRGRYKMQELGFGAAAVALFLFLAAMAWLFSAVFIMSEAFGGG